jgi:hypothetical protein
VTLAGNAASALRPRARVALGALMLTTAASLAGWLLGAPSLEATAVQAAMTEWGGSRLGVPWSRKADEATPRVARRALRGVVLGLAAAGAVYGLGTYTGAIVAIFPTITGWMILVKALGDALVGAVRDEMLLHGLVVRVVDPPPDRPSARLAAIAACALASAAWALGEAGDHGVPLLRLVFEGLGGASYGALWLLDGGAWLPVSAHAAYRFATRGATFAVAASTAWGGGPGGPFAGGCSVAVAGAIAAVALLAVKRRVPESSTP